jgi:hypothetical protein
MELAVRSENHHLVTVLVRVGSIVYFIVITSFDLGLNV